LGQKYYRNIDLLANQLLNSRLHNITTADRVALGATLTIGSKGYMVYDTDLLKPYFWDGAQWAAAGGAVWGSIIGTITAQTDLTTYLSTNYYPLSSNPANYIDLTDLSAGTGISYNNLTGVITNSAPDQTVVLSNGTGINVSGTYPNFTITNTSPSSGGTVTAVTASTPLASSGGTTPNLTIQQASGSQAGYLSSTDWTTFNSKFNLPSLTAGSVLFSNGSTIAQDNANFFWDDSNNRLGIGTSTPSYKLDINGTAGSIALNVNGNINVSNGGNGTNSLNGVLNYFQAQNNKFYGYISFDTWNQGNVINIDANAPNNDAQYWIPLTINGTVGRASAAQPNYLFDISPTYNFTGTYTGITRGIYYRPTITSLNSTTHIAFENTTGDIIHGNLATGGADQMVTVDTNGKLKKQTIPSGGGSVGFEMNFLLMGA